MEVVDNRQPGVLDPNVRPDALPPSRRRFKFAEPG